MNSIELIAAERQRQIDQEGFTAGHDDAHRLEELAIAATCYACPPRERASYNFEFTKLWPWEFRWWKPSPDDRIRELIKAGALIAAEIDRLQRKSKAP